MYQTVSLNIYALSTEIKTFGTANRYIQGPGAIKLIGEIAESYAIKRPLILAGSNAMSVIEKHGLFYSLTQKGIDYIKELFGRSPCGPEACDEEIQLVSEVAESNEVDAIIGAGGGKVIDTAKAVANKLNKFLIIIPTIASSNAPTSAISIIYTCNHVFKERRFYPRNPDIVLVDTEIIAKSPPRFLVCGIGDALGNFTETPSSIRSGAKNRLVKPIHGHPPLTALIAQRSMTEILLTYSETALDSIEAGAVTPALEAVIEAILLLSQIAFETGGLSAAHSIHNGFTILEENPRYKNRSFPCHGELVFFGMLTEMIMDGYPRTEVARVMEFGHRIGLPINLEELGFRDITEEELLEVARAATKPGEPIHNKPFRVTPEIVLNSLKTVNEIGLKISEEIPRRRFRR